MKNEDFVWISQAIQINREVGGNLAEVLDQVNETIRERSEIKGHIKSLAAEGKFSAYILMALPVGIVAMLMVVSPGYMNKMLPTAGLDHDRCLHHPDDHRRSLDAQDHRPEVLRRPWIP
jgi:tight adherence protein B